MQFPILKQQTAEKVEEFISYWNRFYNEKFKKDYWDVIEKEIWDRSDIEKLFKWKNNMGDGEKGRLAPTKIIFVDNATEKLDWINSHKADVTIPLFRKELKKLGPTWGITLLHAMAPTRFPVYDQHVYRSYCYLKGIELYKLKRWNVYKTYSDYLEFFAEVTHSIKKDKYAFKKVDNALWAFGRFLGDYLKMIQV